MKYLSLIALLFTFSSYGIGPTQFDIKDFFSDAKFIGTGVVVSGISLPKNSPENSCGATFEVLVITPILGAKKGETVKLHHIMDNRFSSLEIGSKYFIYAEDKSTHKLINLGDAIDISLNDPRPKSCHSKATNLYIYREFTQKINSESGYSWIGDLDLNSWMGLQQIKQAKTLPWVYSGLKDNRYGMFTESWNYGFSTDNVFGGAPQLEPIIELFKQHAAK
jgi:hypothetical protein